MDIQLPGMSGIECVRELKRLLPDLQLMMLTIYEDDDNVFKSIVAGASGYVLKKTPPSELLEAISDLHHGGSATFPSRSSPYSKWVIFPSIYPIVRPRILQTGDTLPSIPSLH